MAFFRARTALNTLKHSRPVWESVREIHILRTITEVRQWRQERFRNKEKVGFVPTMGALHQGHIALAKRAQEECDVSIVSIFVNPTQFRAGEDYETYPRTLDKDIALLDAAQITAVFAPTAHEMYPNYPAPFGTYVDPVDGDKVAEGEIRPGHFRGVATVCTKLFNIIQPCRSYFGQKDGLQCIVLKRMVNDLNMNTKVVICPTIREPDGLAMSSRNVRLTPESRALAPTIFEALTVGEKLWNSGVHDVEEIRKAVQAHLTSSERVKDANPEVWRPEYVSIADGRTGLNLAPGSKITPFEVIKRVRDAAIAKQKAEEDEELAAKAAAEEAEQTARRLKKREEEEAIRQRKEAASKSNGSSNGSSTHERKLPCFTADAAANQAATSTSGQPQRPASQSAEEEAVDDDTDVAAMLAVAVRAGSVRLIDNVLLKYSKQQLQTEEAEKD